MVDLIRWLRVATDRRRPPAGPLRNEIVFEAPVARLRDFSTARAGGLVPTLVLPPQAGHDSCIVDYSREQSQMRTILAAGLARALLARLDRRHARRRRTPRSTTTSTWSTRAVTHCGGRVNLIGDCQGGWLATIYAALHPERVNTLTIAGAPIDFHAGEPVIHAALQAPRAGGRPRASTAALVAAGGGVLKRRAHAHRVHRDPARQRGRPSARSCSRNLDDPAHVARYREFEDWFKHTQAIPGAFYLWIVEHLFRDNELIAGKLRSPASASTSAGSSAR